MEFKVTVASESDIKTIPDIISAIENSSKEEGVAIALRTHDYLKEKIIQKKAVVAYHQNEWAGFCYLETWSEKKFVSHSGLIVKSKYRKEGLAKIIKEKIFDYSRVCFPNAKIFGLTTSYAVMQINNQLGYVSVDYSELTQDMAFWKGCESCNHFKTLKENKWKSCKCSGFLFDPNDSENKI